MNFFPRVEYSTDLGRLKSNPWSNHRGRVCLYSLLFSNIQDCFVLYVLLVQLSEVQSVFKRKSITHRHFSVPRKSKAEGQKLKILSRICFRVCAGRALHSESTLKTLAHFPLNVYVHVLVAFDLSVLFVMYIKKSLKFSMQVKEYLL